MAFRGIWTWSGWFLWSFCWGLRWAKSRESYRTNASESYRCDSNHWHSLAVISPPEHTDLVLVDYAFVALRFELAITAKVRLRPGDTFKRARASRSWNLVLFGQKWPPRSCDLPESHCWRPSTVPLPMLQVVILMVDIKAWGPRLEGGQNHNH